MLLREVSGACEGSNRDTNDWYPRKTNFVTLHVCLFCLYYYYFFVFIIIIIVFFHLFNIRRNTKINIDSQFKSIIIIAIIIIVIIINLKQQQVVVLLEERNSLESSLLLMFLLILPPNSSHITLLSRFFSLCFYFFFRSSLSLSLSFYRYLFAQRNKLSSIRKTTCITINKY